MTNQPAPSKENNFGFNANVPSSARTHAVLCQLLVRGQELREWATRCLNDLDSGELLHPVEVSQFAQTLSIGDKLSEVWSESQTRFDRSRAEVNAWRTFDRLQNLHENETEFDRWYLLQTDDLLWELNVQLSSAPFQTQWVQAVEEYYRQVWNGYSRAEKHSLFLYNTSLLPQDQHYLIDELYFDTEVEEEQDLP